MLLVAPIEIAARIGQMVLATMHDQNTFTGDTALVIDINLSILDRPPDVYAQFERASRREYWWVPRARYVAARGAVPGSFLDRLAIYQHDLFYEKNERQARITPGLRKQTPSSSHAIPRQERRKRRNASRYPSRENFGQRQLAARFFWRSAR